MGYTTPNIVNNSKKTMNFRVARPINQTENAQVGRTALLLGSFKPPHGGHLQIVSKLFESGDVEEVVIVISAGSKPLPGSTHAIDSTASELMWRAMLGNERRVRIEKAAGTAAEHACQTMQQAPVGTRILVCLSDDHSEAVDSAVQSLNLNSGTAKAVSAEVVRMPANNDSYDTQEQRRFLARGEQGRKQYVSMQTGGLSRMVRERMWRICQSELRDIHSITANRLQVLTPEIMAAMDAEFAQATSTSQCLEFDACTADGNSVRVKYTGDENEDLHFEKRSQPYPRDRLAYAHRCLRLLECHHGNAQWFPRVHYFEKKHGILAETNAVADGQTLMSQFVAGKFDDEIAVNLGKVVAELHATPIAEKPIRGSLKQERSWWERRRRYWCERLDIQTNKRVTDGDTNRSGRCLVHLNLAAENIIVGNGQVALRGFECASSVGDPALDVLTIISNYVTSGAATGQRQVAQQAADCFVDSYERHALKGSEVVRRAREML